MRSLTVKLVVAFVAVTLVAVGILGFLVNRATTAEFSVYLEYGGQNTERATNALSLFYERNGSWANVQAVVRALEGGQGDRIVLTDGSGRVFADSRNILVGRVVDDGQLGQATDIKVNDRLVGVLHVLPGPRRSGNGVLERMMGGLVNQVAGAAEKSFLSAVNDSLLWAAITAGVVALGLSLFLARQIVSPLRNVTAAARRIARGDLSQRVKVDSIDEIGELAASFNTMADSLVQNEALRRNLVASIAHELRTPLSIIQGKLEAMLDGVIEANPQQIASVHEETLLLSRLVADLKELSLADAGQLRIHRQPVNIDELVDWTVARFDQPAREKQIEVCSEVAAGIPPISIDGDRVTQAVSNLISNAIRYSAGGVVRVRAGVEKKTNGQTHRGYGHIPTGGHGDGAEQVLVVSVADQGTGIAPEDLAHVFDRFFRVDRSRTRASGGSGLGLAIVKEIVEAHGGTVWAESEPGKGSTVGFTLPFEQT
ncbi:MAG: ATP-binding protein [Dehalococcoidia bacterium]|nr:ATP-binding protein [Dehalococcoidia bacterium]